MRSPFTGVVFALELTHDVNMLLPLLLAVTIAHGFTVLTLRRSIFTEKVARRGYHLSREYAVDPLEILLVRDIMRENILALPASMTSSDLGGATGIPQNDGQRGQLLYPVVEGGRRLVGVITRGKLRKLSQFSPAAEGPLGELAHKAPVVAYADEPLRAVAYRMAETGLTRFPVVERSGAHLLLGMISLDDLLRARARTLEDEHRRERVLHIRWR
jgi:CBS domain-containing protein